MFQREVAERIVARRATRRLRAIAVLASGAAQARSCSTCRPRPSRRRRRSTSAVVELRPLARAAGRSTASLSDGHAAAFGQRRKMLRHSLKVLGDRALLPAAGIEPTRRRRKSRSRASWRWRGRSPSRLFRQQRLHKIPHGRHEARAALALGAKDGQPVVKGQLEVVVDHHIIVVGPALDLVARPLQPLWRYLGCPRRGAPAGRAIRAWTAAE